MDWIPAPLRELGPCGLEWWQWIGLAAAVIIAVVLGRLAGRVIQWFARRFVVRTETEIDDQLLARLAGPLRLLGALAVLRLSLVLLELPVAAAQVARTTMLALLAVVVVWTVLRIIDVMAHHISGAPWAIRRPTSRALLSLISRTAKVVVVVIALLSFLGSIGLPVASLLAGLGIGGIALAFGAQKTVENLFGAFALGVDQPLREGDFVKIESDVVGTVESVGLRSTRIRTADRTVVTLPNGRLADMKIETFAARDRCRLVTSIGLVYDTTAAQLRECLEGFDRVLRAQPKIFADDIVVRFSALGESSLDIEVVASFSTSDWSEFRAYREQVLIGFMEVVETARTAFAFPTRTVYLAGGAAPPPPRA